MLLNLVKSPDPLLHELSKNVAIIDNKIKKIMQDMLETMYHNHGIGLAAVQVGILQKIIIIDIDYKLTENFGDNKNNGYKISNQNPRFLVNAKIIKSSNKSSIFKEGCLSFPGASSDVSRPKEVTVQYLDFEGKEHIEEMSGLLATCVQHEIDHTNGITFVDHISKLKRDIILKKMRKLKGIK